MSTIDNTNGERVKCDVCGTESDWNDCEVYYCESGHGCGNDICLDCYYKELSKREIQHKDLEPILCPECYKRFVASMEKAIRIIEKCYDGRMCHYGIRLTVSDFRGFEGIIKKLQTVGKDNTFIFNVAELCKKIGLDVYSYDNVRYWISI